MKKSLLFTTGLVTGFVIAAYTPLGKLVPLETVESAFTRTVALITDRGGDVAHRTAVSNLSQFKSLIAAAEKEPNGNILQNEEIVLAAGFIDPESEWAMQFAEIKRHDGVTRAAISNDIATPEEITRGDASNNIGQNSPHLSVASDKIWHARTSDMELDRLRRTVADIKAENVAIMEGLSRTEKTHPDYHMALCVYESNDGLLAFYNFLITMGERGATLEDTKALEAALQEERRQTAEHIKDGRTTAVAYRQVLDGLPARSQGEEKIKALALEYYDSFLLSFDVEDTLATHLTTYPALIAEAIETGEPPYGVSEWVASFQELGRSRMELQGYRQTIAQSLAGPTS